MAWRWLPIDEIDYMVENGYWIDNRFEGPIEYSYEESQECLDSEAAWYAELAEAQSQIDSVETQDAIECRQGPAPRPTYLPELGAPYEDEIPF
jgi:hypothetical protein